MPFEPHPSFRLSLGAIRARGAFALVVSGLSIAGGRAFADGVGEMAVEAATSSDSINSNFLWFGALFAALIAVGLITTLSRLDAFGPTADNLFLSLKLKPAPSSRIDAPPEFSAYLRSLDVRHATFVSLTNFARGSCVRLDLASLPDYPKKDPATEAAAPVAHWVDAEVVSVKSLGGRPPNYLTRVKLMQISRDEHGPLLSYVQTLAHHGRWAQA